MNDQELAEINRLIEEIKGGESTININTHIQRLFRNYFNFYIYVELIRFKAHIARYRLHYKIRLYAPTDMLHKIGSIILEKLRVKGRIYRDPKNHSTPYLEYTYKKLKKLLVVLSLYDFIEKVKALCEKYLHTDVSDEFLNQEINKFQESYFN